MGKLEGKIAIVTGAARGNGEGISRVLAKEGATVVLTRTHKTPLAVLDHRL